MNTDHLSEFLVLSKVLSFSRAADILHTSQSVLSRHIKALEEDLGVQLLRRTSHGVTLTEAGRLLSNQGDALLAEYASAINLLTIDSLPARGVVRIGCSVEISYAAHIRSFLQQFSERYPDIDVSLDVLPETMSEEAVKNYDILLSPCEYPDVKEHAMIANHGTYAVLPPGNRLISQSLIALHQLAGETIVVPFATEFFGPYAKNWLLAEKSTKGRVTQLKAPNLLTALFLVAAGKGVAIVPRYAKNLVPADTFVIGISDPTCRFPEYIYLNGQTENGAAKLFYEEFKAKFVRQ